MSSKSNNYGRAYEFAFINCLNNEITLKRKCKIVENKSYGAAKNAWDNIDEHLQADLLISAASAVEKLFDLEPLLLEGNDILEFFIQSDSSGENGDVRDIIISRNEINWEIGLSIKHNHFAVKHSRIAKTLDFSSKWFGNPCTSSYWNNVSKIFDYLDNFKNKNKKWSEVPKKNINVYVPLLKAFINEIKTQNLKDKNVPRKMVEYLLGEFDFYKIISLDARRITQIQPFNLHGTLNKSSKNKKPFFIIPIANLPTRIISLDMKPGSTNTVELYLDNGWQFNFRIHNASTNVEASLKFDVQIVGVPTNIISINCSWI